MTRVYGHHIWISAWVYLAHSAQQQPYYPFVCFLFITDISRRGALDFSYHSGKNFFLFLTISSKILKVNYSIQFFLFMKLTLSFVVKLWSLSLLSFYQIALFHFVKKQNLKSTIVFLIDSSRFLTYLLGWGEYDTHYGQWTLDGIEITFIRTFAGWRAYIRGSECILFDILD